MAELVIQDVSAVGLEPLYAAASTAPGDTFTPVDPAPGERYLLHVRNADTAAHSVTINDPTTLAPAGAAAFDPDVIVNVAAGSSMMILLDPIDRFIDETTGQVNITYSVTTGMTVGIFRM